MHTVLSIKIGAALALIITFISYQNVFAMGGSPVQTHNTADNDDKFTQTRYPLVLIHGLFGYDKKRACGDPAIDYFYAIPEALRKGGSTVYTPKLSATNSSGIRGEQLLTELRRLKAAYGHQRFHLIGHSHGGHAARYVAAVSPDLVASVLTVGTPHQGSSLADFVQELLKEPILMDAASTLVNGYQMSDKGGDRPQDSKEALRALSTNGAKAFNQRFPQGAPTSDCGSGPARVNGVRYYSAAGIGAPNVQLDSDFLDNVGLKLASQVFDWNKVPNDGAVAKCSARWGVVLRDNYPWDHMDLVNQNCGWMPTDAPSPVAFYRTHANRLKLAGL